MTNNTIHIKPVGDRMNDGFIQLSFTLPVPQNGIADAVNSMCRQMNLTQPEIAHITALDHNLHYVQLFARMEKEITIPIAANEFIAEYKSREEIERQMPHHLTIVGACTGTDAHTVGLDAILNKKGYKGVKGLESYACFSVVNLGSQVSNVKLIAEIEKHKADVLLVSQVITHHNAHIHNLTELMDMLEATGIRRGLLCIVGGPRISQQLATELGFDAGFGIGSTALDVANFLFNKYKAV